MTKKKIEEPEETMILVRDIIDTNMETVLQNIVLVMANRILEHAEGNMNIKLANPVATQMLMAYLLDLLRAMCEQGGIDIADVPSPDGGLTTSLSIRTRH